MKSLMFFGFVLQKTHERRAASNARTANLRRERARRSATDLALPAACAGFSIPILGSR